MDTYLMIVRMLGGLALFLYGMELMSDGIKNSSAGALKAALEKVTSNPVKSFLLGVVITAIIQSSAATIVIVVGLIGAGVLTLKQSVGIVMGANVGTTITAHIIRLMDVGGSDKSTVIDLFTPESIAPVAAAVGIFFLMFVKKGKSKNIGMIAFGIGCLFIGLMNMTDAMKPLAASESFKSLILKFTAHPIYGLVIGIVVTALVQSSSASVGILQTLSSTGAVMFNFSYAYVIGAAMGTCVNTAIVCSIGTKEDAKRVGIIHIIFNVVGAVLFMSTMEILHALGFFPDLWNSVMSNGDIADFQTVFKLVTAVLLMPFIPLLIKTSMRIVKDKPREEGEEEIAANLRELNQQLLLSPVLALEQVKHLLGHMCELSIKNFNSGVALLSEFNDRKMGRIAEREALIDKMADATNNYLISLSPSIENAADNQSLNFLLQTLTEFERIGDLAQNIAETASEMHDEGLFFSADAMRELSVMAGAVREALELSYKSFTELDYGAAAKIEPLEEVIDDMNEMLRTRHIDRLKAGLCSVTGGIYFFDVLINLERLGDQCSDIAVYILGLKDPEITGKEHEYIHNLHKAHDRLYAEEYERNTRQYMDQLKDMQR